MKYVFLFDQFPTVREVEERLLLELLRLKTSNTMIARMLGIGKTTLAVRMRDLRKRGVLVGRKQQYSAGKTQGPERNGRARRIK